ncbi:basic salivary proline-rich protein 2-like, partial [Aedes albopictus]|uniref:Uncharacterized protein n=1 Tax=Aedes albopictus TaxID=7160 RepID=A0ABM1ZQB9_AEDAL
MDGSTSALWGGTADTTNPPAVGAPPTGSRQGTGMDGPTSAPDGHRDQQKQRPPYTAMTLLRPSRSAPVAKNRGPPVGTSDLSGSRDPSGKPHPFSTNRQQTTPPTSRSQRILNGPPWGGAIQRTKKLFEANPGRERPEASCKAPGTSYPTTPNPANQSETDFVSTLAGMARGEPLAPRTPQDRTDNLTGIQPPSPGEHRHHKPKENGQQQTKNE